LLIELKRVQVELLVERLSFIRESSSRVEAAKGKSFLVYFFARSFCMECQNEVINALEPFPRVANFESQSEINELKV
jgi:peroxiredoxin